MNPWMAQCVAAEHTKDLHRQASTMRLARHAAGRPAVPVPAAVDRHRQDREPEARPPSSAS